MLQRGLIILLIGCGPKPTDTSEMTDVNPCGEGEILQADGSCIPAGDPIPPPDEPADTGEREQDTGESGPDTGTAQS